jgi:DNA invertase Pin-like site-specific DNA recombinase
MRDNQPMTSTPRRPAAYLRSASATSPDDQAIQRQRHQVLYTAAALGWPTPTVYTDTGTPRWDRPGSALATLTRHIRAGQHDAVITVDLARISRTSGELAAFTSLCASHNTTLHTLTHGPITPDILPILGSIT